jgi:Uma2 family endonuclease
MTLLLEVIDLYWADRSDYFAGGNMFLYFSALQVKANDYRGPDFFVVLDTERKQRDAWVVWDEGGKLPSVIVEITSRSTEQMDRGEKKRLYGRVLRVPEYFIYDPATSTLEGYRFNLRRQDYEPIAETPEGRLESEALKLHLGTRQGRYHGFEGTWLRWFQPDGTVLPTGEEAKKQAEEAKKQAEDRARELAQRLAEYEQKFGPLAGRTS